ncbi:hypothetical protein [Leptolyngbya sp. GGD]|uniref:hypothetical protein n=1 Tax=Leptolyngbya sp. GGD TaxID=2997907 RepID=UPI002279FB88|nr:hypothetical protein [Leptolyngbya sp. GGD]MCY6494252.1 hypothetical protein [Leptolyngbya sp. GGD]
MPLSSDDLSSIHSDAQNVGVEMAQAGTQLLRDGVEAYARLRNQPRSLKIEITSPDRTVALPYDYYQRGLQGSRIQIDLGASQRALNHHSPAIVQRMLTNSPQVQTIAQNQGSAAAQTYISLIIQRAEANQYRQHSGMSSAERTIQRQPSQNPPQR